jgi:hypothetical protein
MFFNVFKILCAIGKLSLKRIMKSRKYYEFYPGVDGDLENESTAKTLEIEIR